MLLMYADENGEHTTLRISKLSAADLPFLVGQGLGAGTKLFVEAFEKQGGWNVIGNPSNLPHWLGGGESPQNERDVRIQEFTAAADSIGSVIIWASQSKTDKAHVVDGPVWRPYLSAGGPKGWLGFPTGNVETSTEGDLIVDFENGYIGTNDGETFEVFRYPSGQLAYRCEFVVICVLAFRGLSFQEPRQVARGTQSALSPDGTKLAAAHGQNEAWSWQTKVVDIDNPDATLLTLKGGSSPAWSPDGRWIAFVRNTFTGRYSNYRQVVSLELVRIDGTGATTNLSEA